MITAAPRVFMSSPSMFNPVASRFTPLLHFVRKVSNYTLAELLSQSETTQVSRTIQQVNRFFRDAKVVMAGGIFNVSDYLDQLQFNLENGDLNAACEGTKQLEHLFSLVDVKENGSVSEAFKESVRKLRGGDKSGLKVILKEFLIPEKRIQELADAFLESGCKASQVEWYKKAECHLNVAKGLNMDPEKQNEIERVHQIVHYRLLHAPAQKSSWRLSGLEVSTPEI